MSNTNKMLYDILVYLRISAASASKSVAAKILENHEKATVYSKLDGKTSQQKIADSTGVPQRTISEWLNLFVESGLASEPNEFYPSHKALFTLREVGIDMASLKRRKGKPPKPAVISDASAPDTADQKTAELERM
jgi:hypothetical protein